MSKLMGGDDRNTQYIPLYIRGPGMWRMEPDKNIACGMISPASRYLLNYMFSTILYIRVKYADIGKLVNS